MSFEQDISCANKILSRSNNILSLWNKLKNKTRMSVPGFRKRFILHGVLKLIKRKYERSGLRLNHGTILKLT